MPPPPSPAPNWDRSLILDLSLYTLLLTAFSLPLLQQSHSSSSPLRSQSRDLLVTASKALIAVVGGSTALVAVGGTILYVEKKYTEWGVKERWEEFKRRCNRRYGTTGGD